MIEQQLKLPTDEYSYKHSNHHHPLQKITHKANQYLSPKKIVLKFKVEMDDNLELKLTSYFNKMQITQM